MMTWRSDLFHHAFAFKRAVVTPYTFAAVLVPAYISLYVMAVLVQLPRTNFYRAALLPIVFWLNFRATLSLDFSWNHPGYAYLNHRVAANLFSVAMRSATWAFARPHYSRVPVRKSENGSTNGHMKDAPANDVSVRTAMWNALDLVINTRGIGWDRPLKAPIATPHIRMDSRYMFALLSFCQFIFLAFAFDILCTSIHFLGVQSFGTPEGGTIFDPSLPPFERYLKSSIITVLFGLAAYSLLDAVYQFHAVLFSLLFKQHPRQWPPLFDSPWLSTSLSNFWGRRWHQVYREFLVGVGGKPMEKYFGRGGNIMGAFTISAILHNVSVWGTCWDSDTFAVTIFFLMQGVGVIIEYLWKQGTGRRVGGLIGWVWAFFWLISWGNIAVDAWAKSGLLGSNFGHWVGTLRPSTMFLDWMSQKNELL